MNTKTENRFWGHVSIPHGGFGCWEWDGMRNPESDYGKFFLRGQYTGAHRASWEAIHGEVPGGLMVCHHCDNPGCVNPSHLFVGTAGDNARDASLKGRISRLGSKAHLSRGAVESIRRLKESGVPNGEIAQRFGVTPRTVRDVFKRRSSDVQ